MNDYRTYQDYNNDIGEGSFEGDVSITINTSKQEEIPYNPNDLPDFLHWPEYEHWKGFLKLEHSR